MKWACAGSMTCERRSQDAWHRVVAPPPRVDDPQAVRLEEVAEAGEREHVNVLPWLGSGLLPGVEREAGSRSAGPPRRS